VTPQEEYLALLPADGSEVKHDDLYWQLMQAGKHQAASSFQALRRVKLVKFRIDRTDLENPFIWVAKA
jgi:hypothetical protein